jgi:hypothetical protein
LLKKHRKRAPLSSSFALFCALTQTISEHAPENNNKKAIPVEQRIAKVANLRFGTFVRETKTKQRSRVSRPRENAQHNTTQRKQSDLREDLVGRVAAERRLAEYHLVQHATQRPPVDLTNTLCAWCFYRNERFEIV